MSRCRVSADRVGPLFLLAACATATEEPSGPGRPTASSGGVDATGGSTSASGGSTTGGVSIGGTSSKGGSTSGGGSTGGAMSGGAMSAGASNGGASGAGKSGGAPASGGAAPTGGSGGSVQGGASTGGAQGKGGAAGSPSGGAAGAATAGKAGTSDLLFDDFEMGSEQWMTDPAEGWSIVMDGSNNVYEQSVTGNTTLRVAAAGSTMWTDVRLEARVNAVSITSGASSNGVALLVRFRDLQNYYYALLRADGQLALRSRVEGGSTTIESSDQNLETGMWYTIAIQASGSSISVELDGNPVLSVEDDGIATGGIGIATINARAMFDDVRATLP